MGLSSARTYGSAYASFDENLKGTLAPGHLADFVVLSQDIFAIDPVGISRTTVDMTVFGGNVVYERIQI
jgi:predicted amidohydrolase YtcJ